jgi:N-acetylmuramoyl-L-alanine amidase
MKKKLILLSLFILCSIGFGILHNFNKTKEFSLNQNSRNDFERYIDAGYFLQSASLSSLEETYLHPEKKLRILLVPGHTNNSPGAMYKDFKEVDFTFELTEQLYRSFLEEGWTDVEIASLRNEDVNSFKRFFAVCGSFKLVSSNFK